MLTKKERMADGPLDPTSKKQIATIRSFVGLTILLCALSLNLYQGLFPIPSERLLQLSDESWAEAEAKAQRLEDFGHGIPESSTEEISKNGTNSAAETAAKPNSYLAPILRILSVVLAFLLFYFALFLYENESGKLQNRLEEWWIRIYDAQNASLTEHLRILRSLGRLAGTWMDIIFGPKIFSLQAAGVSVCFALAAANLYQSVNDWALPIENHLTNIIYWLLLGIVPVLWPHRFAKFAWFMFLVGSIAYDFVNGLITATLIAFWIREPIMVNAFLSVLVGVAAACALAFFSRGLIRFLLKKVSESGAFVSMIIWLILICVPGALFYKPWYALNIIPLSGGDSLVIGSVAILFSIIVVNSFLLIPSSIFFLLTCLLIAHKLIGGFIHRFIYAFQKLEIAKRNKLMFIVGCVLLGFGLGVDSKFLTLSEKAFF